MFTVTAVWSTGEIGDINGQPNFIAHRKLGDKISLIKINLLIKTIKNWETNDLMFALLQDKKTFCIK